VIVLEYVYLCVSVCVCLCLYCLLNFFMSFQLIIDECGMSKEAESLVAIVSSRAKHIVLVGDHRQLEPVVRDKNAASFGLCRSLFERYAEEAVMLTTQYRMVIAYCH